MGIQTMSSQGGSNQFQPLARQGSLYSFTFDEVQNQLGDLGKPLNSMNLEELLKNVWTAEANLDAENAVSSTDQLESAFAPQRQASLTLTRALSKKTVDEVWRDIQQVQNNNTTNEEKKLQEKQPTLGEMTLEDFLVKAGVVAEASVGKKNVIGIDPMSQNFPEQAPQWFQYQPQSPQQNMMGGFIPEHSGASPPLDDVSYVENQMDMSPPLMGTLLDKQRSGRKRVAPGDLVEKTVERRQKRMIKNRESAARSRARKQAYTNELENKVSRLEEENERLKKQKELENTLPWVPVPEPKYQLRRTSSATH